MSADRHPGTPQELAVEPLDSFDQLAGLDAPVGALEGVTRGACVVPLVAQHHVAAVNRGDRALVQFVEVALELLLVLRPCAALPLPGLTVELHRAPEDVALEFDKVIPASCLNEQVVLAPFRLHRRAEGPLLDRGHHEGAEGELIDIPKAHKRAVVFEALEATLNGEAEPVVHSRSVTILRGRRAA